MVEPVEVSQTRDIRTAIPGPRSLELTARRKASLPAGVGAAMSIFAERAAGGIVVDVDGNSFIDLGGGIAVLNVGSSAPLVVQAVTEQVQRFTHTCFQVTGFESYITLAERLNALVPGTEEKRSFFVNSGAEAVENAVKIARSFTGRQAVVVFDHAFHGRTLLTLSLTAKAMPYKSGFGPFAPEVYRVPFSYPYRCTAGASPEHCGDACADLAIDSMDKQIGANRIACVLAGAGAGRSRRGHPRRRIPPASRRVLQRARDRLHRRRGAGRHGPHGRHVLLRAFRPRPRPRHHRQGARRRAAHRRCHGPGGRHGRRPPRRPRLHLRRQPRLVCSGAGGPGRDRVPRARRAVLATWARSSRPGWATSSTRYRPSARSVSSGRWPRSSS